MQAQPEEGVRIVVPPGCRVTDVCSAADVFSAVQAGVDAPATDITLPDGRGPDLAREARAR